ncbi:MAG TPA: GNAT family N-acetyltransferase [Acidimicrobiales bacterium]|jgi:uncharacterized protein|nr:GNAT family N-acetyltransferase [Acidimicrobiales bacterium]
MATDSISVRHEPDRHRYVVDLDGEEAGFVAYQVRGDGVVVLTHTEVDDSSEGRGVGSTLVAGALEDLRAAGKVIVPQCPFVKKYIERHQEYAALVH